MARNPLKPITILIADDDPDDRLMIREALEDSRLVNEFRFVENGEELMQYLQRCLACSDVDSGECPQLILLDLNMPLKDGREALREIKRDPLLRRIPVVVLTTSTAEEDIVRTYDLGVSSFITKPVTFDALVEVMKALKKYWFEIVELPEPTPLQ